MRGMWGGGWNVCMKTAVEVPIHELIEVTYSLGQNWY